MSPANAAAGILLAVAVLAGCGGPVGTVHATNGPVVTATRGV